MATAAEEQVIPPPPTGEGLTFEKVWAMFQETRLQFQEENAERHREIDRQMAETRLQMQETDKRLDRLSKQMGDLHNRFGEMAEHLVAPGIAKRFNELGFRFDIMAPGGLKIKDENGNVKAQIDLLLENGEYVAAVEIKSKPAEKDIELHIQRMSVLRERKKKEYEGRKILGAIAGAVFPDSVQKAAAEAGLYALVQSGDTVKMELPEGFKPGEW